MGTRAKPRKIRKKKEPPTPKPPKKPDSELTQKERYHKYLQTVDWKSRRDAFRETFGNECAYCGKTDELHIHHLNYDHVGSETEDDVICLCKECHGQVHKGWLHVYKMTQEEFECFKKISHIIRERGHAYLIDVKEQ